MNNEEIQVSEEERTLTPGKIFYNWFAANIGIMGIVFGAMIAAYHLSFIQATLAALVGAFSFALPGWVAMIGKRNGITTFKMSRAAYGTQGNKIPNVIAWMNMVGWLAVNVVTGTLLLIALFGVINIEDNFVTKVIALILFSGSVLLSGLLKENTLAKIQTWISWIFGILTLIIVILFLVKADWGVALSLPSGKWLSGFWPAVSIVAAGSGISWSMAAADWGAYVTPKASSRSTFWSTTLGGVVPLFVLMWGGILLSTIEPTLSTSDNPINVMYHALPAWISVIYFVVAAGGLIPQCIISLRSARINLATVGVDVSQKTSLIIHGLIVIIIPTYVLFVSGNFLGNFELFLGFLGTCLSAWVAIFLCDSVMYRQRGYQIDLLTKESKKHFNWKGIISWIIAVITGFLFTNNAVWNGPFAHGIFKNNSLGVFIAGFAAVICMLVFKILDKSNKGE